MKVGFIGLGKMGVEMAKRLIDGGHEVMVYNRTASKLEPLVAAGAKAAGSVAEAAKFGGVVLTMLGDDKALEAVGAELLEALPAGGVHAAMGTHSLASVQKFTEAHKAKGQSLVSAPVLGRPDAVAAGKAAIVAAGAPEAMARCMPLFENLARRTFDAGGDPAGAATVKVANNFLLGCAIEAMGEAFSLVEKVGVDPKVFLEVVTDGLFASPAYNVYGGIIANKAYDKVGFEVKQALKDLGLAMAAGEAAHVPLPSGNVWRDRLLGAQANGDGDKDWSVMAREQARASGLV